MQQKQILKQLRDCKADLAEQFGATELNLFGSVARNTATASSDLDILIEFDGSATS